MERMTEAYLLAYTMARRGGGVDRLKAPDAVPAEIGEVSTLAVAAG
jgi:hypothetical protein